MMSGAHPEGLHTVTPYFTVADADRLLAFLTGPLAGTVVKEQRADDGTVQHARVRLGDSIVMLNEAGPDYAENDSQIHLFVDDLDHTLDAASEDGATIIMEPNIRPHGDRMAGIVDPTGNTWWLAEAAPPGGR